jgi:hypothetical protein
VKDIVLATLLVALSFASPSRSQTIDSPVLYILRNEQKNQWCGYLDRSRWSSDIDEYGALQTASITFNNAHASVIKLTEEDSPEAGDWVAYDTYQLDDAGDVTSLLRTTNVLPGDLSRVESYQRRQGKLIRQSMTIKSLSTGQPVTQGHNWLPRRSVFLAEPSFPFAGLIRHVHDMKEPFCIDSPSVNSRN